MRPLILDLELTADDVLAILMALRSPEVEVMGISVSSEVSREGVRSALQILELMGRDDIPVYVGAENPLPARVEKTPGPRGWGEESLPEPEMLPAGEAVEFLIQGIRSRVGEVVAIAAGTLTNLALAEERHPGILKQARRVLILERARQDNLSANPQAVHRVLRSGANATLLPFEIVPQWRPGGNALPALAEDRPDPVNAFIRRVIGAEIEAGGGLYLHSPLAVAMSFDPALVSMETRGLEVGEDGRVAVEPWLPGREVGKGYPVECVAKIEAERFVRLFAHRLFGA